MERKLARIVIADMVGDGPLTEANERRTPAYPRCSRENLFGRGLAPVLRKRIK